MILKVVNFDKIGILQKNVILLNFTALSINRIDYCQFLASSHTNFTMTYLADHVNGLSHDAVNRFLCNEKLTARMIWEHVQGDITPSDNGCLVFDDSILDKGTRIALKWSNCNTAVMRTV